MILTENDHDRGYFTPMSTLALPSLMALMTAA